MKEILLTEKEMVFLVLLYFHGTTYIQQTTRCFFQAMAFKSLESKRYQGKWRELWTKHKFYNLFKLWNTKMLNRPSVFFKRNRRNI